MAHCDNTVTLARATVNCRCHVCAFFNSREDEYAVLLPFLNDGFEKAAEAAERIARPSACEREVLDALVAGRPHKVIAFDLGISIRTVEVNRARMIERLGVRQFADRASS